MIRELLSRLTNAPETAATLRDALDRCLAQEPCAIKEMAQAQEERVGLLLRGDDTEVLIAEDKINRCRLALDRVRAMIAELQLRCTAAEKRELEEALTRKIDSAETAAEAAVQRWREEYEISAKRIQKLVVDLWEADEAVRSANRAAATAGQPGRLTIEQRLFGTTAHGTPYGDLSLTSLPHYRQFPGLGAARERATMEGWCRR
jgi:hypothetical protein